MPTPIDLKGLNTGSAVSAPGPLSSTNLSGLGGLGGNLSPFDPNNTAFDPSAFGGSTSPALSGVDLSALNDPVNVGTLNTGTPNANFPTDPATGQPPASATGSQGLLSSLGSLIPSASTLAGLAPTAAAGAIGLAQAKSSQQQNQALANQLAALGGPYTAAGQKLLAQWQSGQISPAQQNVVGTLNKQGQTLMDSAAPLSAIAQAAYQNYQSGTLPPADEQRLNDQVAAQKQQVAQQLASAGITDSTILAGQNAQIDNQAKITRQQLLDARFATGNQAYDQWLSATTQGQALQAEASKFAASSLDTMLTQSLNLSAEGMQPIEESIQLEMQSNNALSAQVNQLMGNLAAAYAYQTTGGNPPGGGASGSGVTGAIANALKGLGGSSGGSGGPSAGSITATDNAGLDFGNSATQQGAIDASAPTLDPNTISGLESTLDPNFGDPSAGPNSAGGEAAMPDLTSGAINATAPNLDPNTISGLASTSSGGGVDLSSLGSAAGIGAGALGVYQGLSSGKPVGEARAAVGATQLAGKAGLVSPQVGAGAGALMGVLGIYSGLQQGGVAGGAGALVGAGQLAGGINAYAVSSAAAAAAAGGASSAEAAAAGVAAGTPALQAAGQAAAYVAAPLDLYNEITTWKSGATGKDALSGAETGAAIGTIILPGFGTVIGGALGGIAGAVSSLFGSTDRTKRSWDQYSYGQNRAETANNPAELMSTIGGLMRNPDTKFSGDTYFKGDGNKFTTSIASQVASAVKSGAVPANATPQQIFSKVVQPWLEGLPGGWTQADASDPNRARVANAEQNLVLDVINNYQQGKPITYGETVGQKAEYSYTPYSQLKGG